MTTPSSSGWQSGQLGDFIELKRGYDLPNRDRREGPFPIVSSSGPSGWHSEAKAKAPGVVTGRYGTIGQVFFVETDYWPLNTALYVRDFKGNHPRFVSYFLRSVDFNKYVDKAAVPGVNRNHVHLEHVSFPPLPEQRRIAAILGALDDKIELNRKMNRTLEEMAQALFKSWFIDFDGHDPEGLVDSELGPIPKGWEVSSLGAVMDHVTDGAHRSPETVAGGRPMASVKDLTNWGIELSGCRTISPDEFEDLVRNGCQPLVGDILLAKDGANCLQTVCEYRQDDALVLLSSIAILRPSRRCPASFLHAWFSRKETITYLREGFVSGSAIPRVVLRTLKKAKFVLPPHESLRRFDETVTPLRRRIVANFNESRTLAELRDTLLPKLISGEIRVPEAEDAVEAAL